MTHNSQLYVRFKKTVKLLFPDFYAEMKEQKHELIEKRKVRCPPFGCLSIASLGSTLAIH